MKIVSFKVKCCKQCGRKEKKEGFFQVTFNNNNFMCDTCLINNESLERNRGL